MPAAAPQQGARAARQVRLVQAGGLSQEQRDRISVLALKDFPTEAAFFRTLLLGYVEFPEIRAAYSRVRSELSKRIGRRLVDRGAIVPVEER